MIGAGKFQVWNGGHFSLKRAVVPLPSVADQACWAGMHAICDLKGKLLEQDNRADTV
jgi:hypothetical protein